MSKREDRLAIFDSQTTNSVQCLRCGKLYDVEDDSESYITVYGDITIGKTGGVVGGNFNEGGILFRVSVYCRDRCLQDLLLDPTHPKG